MTHNDIIQTLCSAGFPTFLVGGAVRDLFAGFEPHDFDITTRATPEQIAEVFPNCTVQKSVGKSFGVTLVNGIEVATFRLDRFPNGNGAKNCEVSFAESIHDDLARRDLTVNAVALCSLSGDVIDDHDGLQDLQDGLIRFVGDPDARILEDPDRIVRACRFVAKLQGRFEQSTLEALQRNVHLVGSSVKLERVGIEVLKALKLEHPSLFFSALEITGALEHVFPGFSACVNHEHGQWHKETVWEHLLLAGDSVNARFPLVRLAAFLHDVGKPAAFVHCNDGTFVEHEIFSAELVDAWLRRLRFSNEDRETVVGLVRCHMLGSGVADLSAKAVRRLRFRLDEHNVSVKDWLRLRVADRRANVAKDALTLSDIKLRARVVGLGSQVEPEPAFTVSSLALKGGELIKLLNLSPSPIVGKLQKHLVDFVIERGFEFNTPEILLSESLEFLNNK